MNTENATKLQQAAAQIAEILALTSQLQSNFPRSARDDQPRQACTAPEPPAAFRDRVSGTLYPSWASVEKYALRPREIEAISPQAALDAVHEQLKKMAEKLGTLVEQERAEKDVEETVHGEGAEEYQVLLTLDTTAARFVRVLADSPEAASEFAHDLAVKEQGAYFEMNEGNQVRHDDVSVTAVMDKDGNDIDLVNSDSPVP